MIQEAVLSTWCAAHEAEQIELLKTIAAIPAPSHFEQERARFILQWLHDIGANEARLDEVNNVLLPVKCDRRDGISLYMAHTDVVFPDTTPLPVREEGGRLYAPGVGDDTANVVALMLCAKFMFEMECYPAEPVLIAFNVCEEGLGNLKGVRHIMESWSGRIRSFVSFDGELDSMVDKAVGSERWKVTARTEGGHSYGDFGNRNAIHSLASLIGALYTVKPLEKDGSKTTYNVGKIEGGTSVNTIAQEASMLYEYRSDNRECLEAMRKAFQATVGAFEAMGTAFETELLGVRPCMGEVDKALQAAHLARCARAITQATGAAPATRSGSTDANIPFSLGIPSAVFGLYRGDGAHTREEYVELASLKTGLLCALRLMLYA
ncbi:MAG TPA: M20/M25/M40 family metallo-hydrolase [Clostridia bacterium]|nr:M20/M25/M40 family metallo-hydrolase [Clostridia bacterium]